MKVVFDALSDLSFESLVDVGCGDGRFLREMEKRYAKKEVLGVDYSQRAIALAQAMNPGVAFETRNILEDPIERTFDVATLIEVLEHIPPDAVEEFINQVHDVLKPGGYLILTVPHANKPVSDKHYQHFDSGSLRSILSPFFQNLEFIPFDSHSRLLSLCQYIIGGSGDHFVITNSTINNIFIKIYVKKFLYNVGEDSCGRIAVICKA